MKVLITTVLTRVGIEYETAIDGRAAMQRLRTKTYSALLLDIMLPDWNGFEVIRELKLQRPDITKRRNVRIRCAPFAKLAGTAAR